MKINWQNLKAQVPSELLAGFSIRELLGVVGRTYCGPMTVRGLCTGNCQSCKAALVKSFTFDHTSARRPSAILTWRLKDASAAAAEISRIRNVTVERDPLGIPAPEKDSRIDQIIKELGF